MRLKELKYSNLSVEIQRMLNRKCSVIPAVIAATETVTTRLKKLRHLWENIHEILCKKKNKF